MASSELDKYRAMSDHDLAILTAAKLDGLGDKLDSFIIQRIKTQEKHECRMQEMEERADNHETRINSLETYFKVAVGAIVLAVTVFGVYVIELIVKG